MQSKVGQLAGLLDRLAPPTPPARTVYPVESQVAVRTPLTLEMAHVTDPTITTREVALETDPPVLGHLEFLAETHLTNVLFRDVFQFSQWAPASGSTFRGCAVVNTGDYTLQYSDQDSGRAHSGYCQNNDSARPVLFDGHIAIAGYGIAFKIYASGTVGNFLSGYRLRNSIFGGKSFIVGGAPTSDVVIEDCAYPHCVVQLGYKRENVDVTARRLVTPYLSIASNHQRLEVTGCTLTGRTDLPTQDAHRTGDVVGIPYASITSGAVANWVWDYNTYYVPRNQDQRVFAIDGYNWVTFEQWKTMTGFDAHSVVVSTPLPQIARVYPVNEGDHLANVCVMDFPGWGAAELALDVPDGRYRLVNVEAYFEDVRWLDVQGGKTVVQTAGKYTPPQGAKVSHVPPLTTKLAGTLIGEVWR